MKHTYVKPETEVLELQSPCLLLENSPNPDDPLDGIIIRDSDMAFI